MAYDQPGALRGDLALLSDPKWSRRGSQYSRLHIALAASRVAAPYVWNLVVIQCILVSMGLMTFSISPDSISDRLGNNMNTVLATVAFKFVIAGDIPKVEYHTWLDKYCLGSFLFLATIAMEHVAVYSCGMATTQDEKRIIQGIVLLWVVFNASFGAVALSYSRERRRFCLDVKDS